MSEGIEARLRHHEKDTPTQVHAGDVVEVLDTRDALITAQADIIQRYAQHTRQCESLRIMIAEDCTCGLSAALAALPTREQWKIIK